MGSDWQTVGDLAANGIISLSTGPFGSALHKHEYRESGVSVVPAEAISDGKLDSNKFNYIEDEKASELTRYFLESGDLVFARRGAQACGHSAYVTEEHTGAIAGTGLLFARVLKPDVLDPLYFYLVMSSSESVTWLKRHAIGATMPNLNTGIISSTPFSLIPLDEQHAVIRHYTPLRRKLSLLKESNATLEAMAQALFKSWFVDFDPVIDNALAAGNPIPEALAERAEVRRQAIANGTANREAAKAFPDSFQETEVIGWIPEGWETSPVSEALSINPTTKLSKGTIAPFADMKALPTSGYAVNGIIEKAFYGGAKFKMGDVLLARITPCLQNGKTGIVDFLTDSSPVGFGSTEFIVLRGKNELDTAFIACLARDSNFRKHCEQSMIGSSGRQRVHNSCFESYHLALPQDEDIISKFNNLAGPAFVKSSRQSNENKTLAKLRDTLLPKLISGELRISDAEQLTEEALG